MILSRLLKAFAKSICMAIAVVGLVSGQEARQVRWQFAVGDEYQVVLEQQTAITTNIDTRRKKIGNVMQLMMDWKVEAVDEDLITINQSIRRIHLKTDTPTKNGIRTTEIDTDVDEEQSELGLELLKQVRPLVNADFKVAISPRGEIVNVTVPQESMDALRNAPASMRLREVLSVAGLQELIGQAALVFPDQAIKPGDTWKSTAQIKNAFGTVERLNIYTFDGAQEREGISGLEFSMKSEIDVAAPDDENALIDKYAGNGSFWFAPTAKTMLESRFENSMQTRRTRRDRTILTSISTAVTMKVARQ